MSARSRSRDRDVAERFPLLRRAARELPSHGPTWLALPSLAVVLAVLASPFAPERGPAVEPRAAAPHEPPPPPPTARELAVPERSAGSHRTPARAPEAPSGAADADGPAQRPAERAGHRFRDARTSAVRVTVVDGATRRPVRGAALELRHSPAEGSPARALRATDADGAWEGRLAPGELIVAAWRGGAVSEVASLELRAGGAARHELALAPAFPVQGIVRDAVTGRPVEGARVSFWTHAELDVALTGADGRFVHPRFPRRGEAHQVRVEAGGFGSEVRYLEVGADGAWSLLAAREGAPHGGGAGAPARIELELVPELELTGRVLDAAGRPLAGAEVVAEGHFSVLVGVGSGDRAAARSDAGGRFRLTGLRSDVTHSVAFAAPGCARRAVVVAPARTVHGSPNDLGDVQLEPGGILAGHVLDAVGLPAEGLRVTLQLVVDEPGGRPPAAGAGRDLGAPLRAARAATRSDADGAFLFADLAAGRYRLRAESDAGRLAEVEVELGAGEERAGVALVLPADALALTGTVRDGGLPVAGATVELGGGRRPLAVTTDAFGRFRALGLRDIRYELRASATSSAGRPIEWTPADVAAGEDVALETRAPRRR